MTAATTTVIPTDPSVLPQHNGRPVPWVTRWTGEVIPDPVAVSMDPKNNQVWCAYKDGLENREANGILWLREGLGRKGEPVYADFNTYRQRACMIKRRCQVCGSKITDRVITWLMTESVLDTVSEGEALTASPPTCASCVPLAQSLCPHLKAENGGMVLRVLDYEVFGVRGGIVFRDSESGRMREIKSAVVEYAGSHPGLDLTAVVAKQQIVKLTKYVIQ